MKDLLFGEYETFDEAVEGLKKKIKEEMAREILEKINKESNGQTISITNLLRKQFGVEIKE